MTIEGRGREFVAFDLETTGLMAETDRVVEVGAVRFDGSGRELGRFERLVNPERKMAPAAQAVHGISDADLAGAPTAREVLPEFLAFLGDASATTLLAHNASFDARFLGRECGRTGLSPPGHAVVDTLALARRKLPEVRNHQLDTLARLFDLDPNGPHRALADSLRVKGLWLALGGGREPGSVLVSYPVVDDRRSDIIPNGWDAVADAIARGLTVRMEYEGGRGGAPREVTPRAFAHRGGVTYLIAYCHIDAFEKSFRIDRVRRYEVVLSHQSSVISKETVTAPAGVRIEHLHSDDR
jgi:DNA polymerase III epsilon subunit family exonuclease